MKKLFLSISCALILQSGFAQTDSKPEGELTGNFQNSNQFYVRDDRIETNTTQYFHEKSSSDAWLYLNYKTKGYSFTLRYDLFNNSPLFVPTEAYTANGIGIWSIQKQLDKFNITIGSFYDQFGTGTAFRAFEDRNLGLDYAIQGARIIWTPDEFTRVKAFTGKQKNRLYDPWPEVIKGINAERHIDIAESFYIEPGLSVVNRTLDNNSMAKIQQEINNDSLQYRFEPKYNAYVLNAYTTIRYNKFSGFLEYCHKTSDNDRDAANNLRLMSGDVYYASVSYSTKGLGINGQFKKIDHFTFRTSPFESQNQGLISYLPSITRQNVYRLLARYNAVAQYLGENASQLEINFKPQSDYSKKHQMAINVNHSFVMAPGFYTADLINPFNFTQNNMRYFREYYFDFNFKVNKKFKYTIGYQNIEYNQALFEGKAIETPYVISHCYFGEATYKYTPTRSIRIEAQYLNTKQDRGSFINALIEFNFAPHYSFSAGDMLNVSKGYFNTNFEEMHSVSDIFDKGIHYWNVFGAYTTGATRFTAGFIKQVQGVNCTGGVCRVEPAFSGARITMTTSF